MTTMSGGHPSVAALDVERLSDEQRGFLGSLPETVVLDVDGLGDVRFCHATPRSDEEIVTQATPDRHLRKVLARTEESVVVAGHTHMQLDRRVDGFRWVNAGSVGMPYEGEVAAFWALLGPDVELAADTVRRRAKRRRRPRVRVGPTPRRSSRRTCARPWSAKTSCRLRRFRDRPRRAMTEHVVVGRVGKPHGIGGAFVVEHPSDDAARFAVGAELVAGDATARVEESKRSGGRFVVSSTVPSSEATELRVPSVVAAASRAGFVLRLSARRARGRRGGRAGAREGQRRRELRCQRRARARFGRAAPARRSLRPGDRPGGPANRCLAGLRRP